MSAEADLPNAPSRDLGGAILRGTSWTVGASLGVQVLGFATTAVLARLIGPHALGLAGMALVFTSLALVMVDSGFGAAIVQRATVTSRDLSSTFWASMAIGVFMTLLGVGLSWPIAALFGEPKVQALFAVMSLSFLFTAPCVVPDAILARKLRFRELQTRQIAASVVSCSAAMLAAALGAGPWALVIQVLVISAVATALTMKLAGWCPTWECSRAELRGIAGFGGNVLGAKMTDWATQNCDNLLVGRFLGATPLGVYSLAFNIAVSPLKRIAMPIADVLFPAFSRMEGPAMIAATWHRAVRITALVAAPLLFGIIALAPDFVELAFGPRWHRAVPVLRLLAAVGLMQALTQLGRSVLQAIDRARLLFRYTLLASIVTVGAFAVGLIWGLTGVAVAYLASAVLLQPVFVVLTSRALGVPARRWWEAVSGVVQAALGMLAIVVALHSLLHSLPLGVRFVLCVLAGAASYLPLVRWRAPEVREDLRGVLRRLRPASGEGGLTPVTTGSPAEGLSPPIAS